MAACLKMPELMEIDQELPMGALSIGLVTMPGLSSMSSSHIIMDDAMGLTYLDTVTTSIGRIILREPDAGPTTGLIIEDVTGQEWGAHWTCHWVDKFPLAIA